MTKDQGYALRYIDYVMVQMQRYSILVSVTLAQDVLESSNGRSRLARSENNYFGIKTTSSWIAEDGRYEIYTDDKPNEKLYSYDNVGDSYEHHSRFLKENSHYAGCFEFSPNDYEGWTQSIEKAGYVTDSKYAESLQKIIEQDGLQRYDRQTMREMTVQGRQLGVEHNPFQTSESAEHETRYSLPMERKEFLFITSPFGARQDPLDSTKRRVHKGVDIRCRTNMVLATESGGKVVAANQNKNTPGGKSLTVEYAQAGGSKVQCTYMHLKEISAKIDDTVQTGGRLGTSGSMGIQATGGHLHFSVKNIYTDGTKQDIDPAAYLAETAQKGRIKLQMLHNGNDLLVKYRVAEDVIPEKNLSPGGWIKKLLSSGDSGVGISGCDDPIVETVMTALASLMLLAIRVDSRKGEEQRTAMSAAMDLRTIDLKPLLPNMKNYDLTISENGKTILKADDGELHVSRELAASELSRLSATLNNGILTEEAKQMRVTSMLNTVILSEAASQNFEQGMTRQQGQTENLQR